MIKKAFLDDKNIIYQAKNFASNAAAKADKKILEMIYHDQETYTKLTKDAQRSGNLVAFITLDSIIKKTDISTMLREKHIPSLTNYFINKNPNLYDTAITFAESGQLLDFLQVFWSVEGARKALIRKALKHSAKLTEPMLKMTAQLMQYDMRSFAEDVTYLIGHLAGITFQRVEHIQSATTYELVMHDAMDPKVFSNIRVRFNRFNISIRHALFQPEMNMLEQVPARIFELITRYLGTEERKNVFMLSAGINNIMLSAKPMDVTAKNREKIRALELAIENLEFVLDLLMKDTKRHFDAAGGLTTSVGLVMAACLVLMIYYTDQYGRTADQYDRDFFNAIIPHSNYTTCSDLSKYRNSIYASCNYDTILEFCKAICSHFKDASGSEVGLIVGDVFTGIIVLMILGCGLAMVCSPRDGKASSSLLSDKSLAQIKEAKIDVDLETAVGAEFDKRKLENSIDRKLGQLTALKALLPPDEKIVAIEVKDDNEDEKEEKKVTSPSNNYPFWQQAGAHLALSLDSDEENILDPMHPLLG